MGRDLYSKYFNPYRKGDEQELHDHFHWENGQRRPRQGRLYWKDPKAIVGGRWKSTE